MVEENSFGNILSSLRVKKGTHRETEWTQGKVARQLGVSRGTYNGWENGKSIPSTDDLENIVNLFDLNEKDKETLYRAAARVSPEIHNSRLPRRNPFFTGREAQLAQLAQRLKENGSVMVTQPIAISGLGGIGKTQLVLEYAYRHHPEPYRAVFWVNAASNTTLQEDFDDLAHLLKLPERTENEPERRVQAVKLWLDRHSEWLLIMDNADDLPLMGTFLPVTPRGGHIILTTRSQTFGDITSAVPIAVEEMEPEDGLLFLLWRSGILKDTTKRDTVAADVRETAVQLVELLEQFPLALDQAAAYIEETGVSLADYLQLYQEKRRDLLDRRGSSKSPYGQHPESVVATFKISFEGACKQHALATDLLHFCAFLQPDAIPEEVLLQADDLQLDASSLNEVIAALQRYSLIRRTNRDRTFSMHRLVQAVLRDGMPADLRRKWQECIIRTFNAFFPEIPQVDFKEWTTCGRLLPHVLVCATWTENERAPAQEASELFNKSGLYVREQGQYIEAETLLLRALSIREQQLGSEHTDTANSMNNLSIIYRQQGKYEQAELLCQRVLASREQHFGADHLETAKSLNNLANIYRNQGQYEQAELLYKRALAIKEQQLGAEHLSTVMSLNNLANLYADQGKYEQAELLYKRALAIRERQLGETHPLTATSLNNLAVVFRDQGKYEQAEPLYRRALAIREQQLGEAHPNTATCLHNLATVYRDQGQYERAEPLYLRTLEIYKQQLGETHPNTATCLHNLAILYRDQGKYEQAEPLFRQALSIRDQQLGSEHPDTAESLHGMAKLYQQQGKYEQAETLYRRALAIREQHLLPTHPDTQVTRKAYAALLRIVGRDAEAAAIESSQS